jgi:hypothetical protein
MNQGEVLAMGTPREVQTDPGVIEAYLGSVDEVSSLRRMSADGPPLGAKAPSGGSAAALAANVGADSA